ncbi:ATP-binding cassette sub-family g member 2, partial [Plakobranchus ocellatus]
MQINNWILDALYCWIILLLFGGFLIQFDSIGDWLSWLQYFSIFKYGMTALYIIEFKDRQFCNGTDPTD